MFKKLIRKIQWVLLRWHRRRYYHYLAKRLGATYYLNANTVLSSTYGVCLGKKEYDDIYKVFHSGKTHASHDVTSAYPAEFIKEQHYK